MIKLNIRNIDRINRRLMGIEKKAKKNVAKVVKSTAADMENNIVREMRLSPASGARYGRHIASASGNAPRIDHGDLVNAVKTRISRLRSTSATIGVHAGERDRDGNNLAERAYWLEVGTSRMDPRPVYGPTMRKFRGKFENDVRKAIKQALKQARRIK